MKNFATLLPNDLVAGTPHPHQVRRLGRQSAERDFKAKLMGTDVRYSCGKSASTRDPAGVCRRGSRTARGKRVPVVETHVQFVQASNKS
ncbi:hypothetical protein FOA20_04970 [Peribacillus simplex]